MCIIANREGRPFVNGQGSRLSQIGMFSRGHGRREAADVLAIGPGLGDSITPACLVDVLGRFAGPVVIDADGLNLLARAGADQAPSECLEDAAPR